MSRREILAIVGNKFTLAELNEILCQGGRRIRYWEGAHMIVSRLEKKVLRVTYVPAQGDINSFKFALAEIKSFRKALSRLNSDPKRKEFDSDDELLQECFNPK